MKTYTRDDTERGVEYVEKREADAIIEKMKALAQVSESDEWKEFANHFMEREGFFPNCRDYHVITLLWYWRQSRRSLKTAIEAL